jgi:DNA repair photolyase
VSLRINQVVANSILTKSKLPIADYVINPYIGCMHACAYCYAKFIGGFTGHAKEPWGSYLDVKLFNPEKLRRQLARLPVGTSVFLGSMTDAYQAIERKQHATRRILEASLPCSVGLSTLTKSDLVARDVDLWSQIPWGSVGFSISTTDDGSAAIFEKRCRPVSKRLEAMETMHRRGIDVFAFVGPILPLVTDLRKTMSIVAKCCGGVMAGALNLRCGNRANLEAALSTRAPDIKNDFFRLAGDPSYWQGLREEYHHLCNTLGIRNLGFLDYSGVMDSKASEREK